MKTKTLAILGLSGLLFLLVTLFTFVTVYFFYPPLLVSYEFATAMSPFALIGATYVGLSIALIYFSAVLQIQHERWKNILSKLIIKRAWSLLVLIFASISLGYMTFYMIIRIPAIVLHLHAAQESVEIQAIATSARPAAKNIKSNCQYHLTFYTPRISPSIQFVCISWNQWLYFREVEFPITVTLYGKKSYYGYELYCK